MLSDTHLLDVALQIVVEEPTILHNALGIFDALIDRLIRRVIAKEAAKRIHRPVADKVPPRVHLVSYLCSCY